LAPVSITSIYAYIVEKSYSQLQADKHTKYIRKDKKHTASVVAV